MSKKGYWDQYVNTDKEKKPVKKTRSEKKEKTEEKPVKKRKEEKKESSGGESITVKITPELEDVDESILLSVDYDGKLKKAYCRLYDIKTNKIIFWYDNTNHLPYFLTDLAIEELDASFPEIRRHGGFVNYQSLKKYDLITDEPKDMVKIIVTDPLAVGGGRNSIREVLPENNFEAFIFYSFN